ncbi:nicotinate-nucleotide--dimethylbenzimidazole phosphoribosyltransferase [Streptomyces sp. 7-21]|uniref:nicotinate-nucleotide--dimethylbenzimidazole phosphoribosyltransferase n=1 Tax=Streptomyces sp. 7-21 TaxID=2802283 RepID=UPI00191CCDF4|nr:nicotinate-nucleotide--dimethylbenzimidazole phosphoribosyltransferase [Streptomyces sp. 7-21]MBL1066708.1 nicotinate-nucleotide--dimethylbenzimidazole phosphoribosyltransferase [Streptomyces sp. 7-21]
MSDGGVNLDAFGKLIERPSAQLRRDAAERRAHGPVPPRALGRLDETGAWLSAVQGRVPAGPIERPKAVLFAGDHGVAALGVSARPQGGAVDLVRGVLDGTSPVAVLARGSGVPVRVVDTSLDCPAGDLPAEVTSRRVRRGSGRLDVEDSLTLAEAEEAFQAGVDLADEEADSGTDLIALGDISVGGTTAAGVLIAAMCGTDASVVTGRGGQRIDDLMWMRKCAAIRDGLRRARPVIGDQLRLLATAAGADLTAMTGFLLQCAVRRTPVILDGVVSAACALVAQRIAFRSPDWWIAGHASGEPGQAKALDRLSMRPLLDHGVTAGEGTGALLALPLVRAAAQLAAELPAGEEPGTGEPDAADPASAGGPDGGEAEDAAAIAEAT